MTDVQGESTYCATYSANHAPLINPHSFLSRVESSRSPEDVTNRLDRLISEIRTKYQIPHMSPSSSSSSDSDSPHEAGGSGDVLVVGHGHILRAFAMRWVGKTLQEGPTFLMEAGGVGTLSYEHHSVREPAVLLGGAFVVDEAERIPEARKD